MRRDYFILSAFKGTRGKRREAAKVMVKLRHLSKGENSTLKTLDLHNNNIDDEGVATLIDALQNNASLRNLDLKGNDGISKQAQILLLELVFDISSIKATLQSNYTLKCLSVERLDEDEEIQTHIDKATMINSEHESNPEAAGWEKVIQAQLHSTKRAELANLLGVNHSSYSEINTLHLPEVLSLVGHSHGQGELYVALRSSIAGVTSTVNTKQCIEEQMAHHSAKLEELGAS
eukprot:scaffold1279_cov124-Skeletonema_dohrnii-CCMP3373.AAC.4